MSCKHRQNGKGRGCHGRMPSPASPGHLFLACQIGVSECVSSGWRQGTTTQVEPLQAIHVALGPEQTRMAQHPREGVRLAP